MTQERNKIKIMTIAALLSAIGIVIPTFSPFKILLEPASFTLASHVPIFIAMFISPLVGAFVALVTSLGFFLTFPPVVGLRALSHILFVVIGALILKKQTRILQSFSKTAIFAFLISIIHALAEVVVVSYFYFGGSFQGKSLPPIYQEKGFVFSVIVLVGIGTLIHSMVDFYIALFIWKPIQNTVSIPVNAKVK